MNAVELSSSISAAADRFKKEGYLVIRQAFAKSDSIEFQKEVKGNPALEESSRIKFAGGKPSVKEVANVFGRSQAAQKMIRNSVALKIIEEIVGEYLYLFRDAYIEKLPNQKSIFPLHQDSEFFKIVPECLVSMWVPLQDTSLENGVLHVVPYSHLSRLDHSVKFGKKLRLPKLVNRILRNGASNSNAVAKKMSLPQRIVLDFVTVVNSKLIPFLSRYFTSFEKFTEFFVVQDDERYWENAVHPDLKLGDVIVYHSLALHGSKGNSQNVPRAEYTQTFMGENYTRDGSVVSSSELGYISIKG